MLHHNMAVSKTQKHNSWPKSILLLLHITSLLTYAIVVYMGAFYSSLDQTDAGLGLVIVLGPNLYLILIPFIWDLILLERCLVRKLGNTILVKITTPILMIGGYLFLVMSLPTTFLSTFTAATLFLVTIVGLVLLLAGYVKRHRFRDLCFIVLISLALNCLPITTLITWR